MDLYGYYVGVTDAKDSYDEVTVVWEGMLESVTFWTSGDNFDAWIEKLEADALASGDRVEVYILSHGHDVDIGDEEDTCAQYLTDHRPDYAFDANAA